MTDLPSRLTAALADRYIIERQLGEGGMATVYLAQDLRHEREVALKVLKPGLAEAIGVDRFVQEIRLTARLRHPHIVPLFDSGNADGFLYFVMPRVKGRTLADRMKDPDPIEPTEALRITLDVIDALAHAHDQGVIHRDIKPGNIMLDGKHATVADFGVAGALEAPDATRLTQTDTIVGTATYMAPEQAWDQDNVDARADIYSLGCVLFEMLAHRPPFEARTALGLLTKHMQEVPPRIAESRPDLDPQIGAMIERALKKNPDERYTSAAEWRALLERILGGGLRASSLQRRRHNLPAAVDSFVGREEEIEEVVGAFETARLVSITGVGGTGKTRLATTVGERLLTRFQGGVWMVELAPVLEERSVPHAIAETLDIRIAPGLTVSESVIQSLELRSVLLILDNCEHVLEAVADLVGDAILRCPDLRVLATSRESLAVRGERVLRLSSLSDEQGAALFRDRARDAGSRSEMRDDTLLRLSRRLDGIPLAIELAAARMRTMSPEEIESRLEDRFRLLRGSRRGRMERHQTLRNAVAWSYDLLGPVEQKVFDRLSVFTGGCTLDAAIAVTVGEDLDEWDVEDAITALVDRSMLTAAPTRDGTWYRQLETLRQYGEEKLLESGESSDILDRHLSWYVDFAERAVEAGLWSPEDEPWWRALDREFENIGVAYDRAVEKNDGEAATAILSAIATFTWHWYRMQVIDWAIDGLRLQPEPGFLRPWAACLLTLTGRHDEAGEIVRWTEGADRASLEGYWELWLRYLYHVCRGEVAESAPFYDRVASDFPDFIPAGHRLFTESMTVWLGALGRHRERLERSAAALEKATAFGNTFVRANAEFHRGTALIDLHPEEALRRFDESILLLDRIGERFNRTHAVSEGADALRRLSRPREAMVRIAPALRDFIETGDSLSTSHAAHILALILVELGRDETAGDVWRELGPRQSYATIHRREELTERLGPPGESRMSDMEFRRYLNELLNGLQSEFGEG